MTTSSLCLSVWWGKIIQEDILDPAEDPPDAPRTKDFPRETFRVLREREIKQYGEYRTKRLVLEAWDRLPDQVRKPTDTVTAQA